MSSISLYGISGWIIAGIGVCLIIIGIFARRIVIRTSPQCAKCGYPLVDVPIQNGSVVCPECGRSPVGATETYTMRWRRLPIALGIVLFLGALILPMVPTMRTQGWTAALPMSVQIRMWATGDNRLRQRVITAFRNDKIMGSKRELLRSKLMAAFNDPNTPKPIIESAIEYLRYTFTKNELLDEQDLASIASDETSNVRWLYMRYTKQYTVPQTPEMQEIRRSLAWDTTNEPAQRSAIEWLLKSPSDDEEDLETIRRLIVETDKSKFWTVRSKFDDATGVAVEIAISLLSDESTVIRSRALYCLQDIHHQKNNQLSDEAVIRILGLIVDPVLSRQAMMMVQNLPLSAEPMIDELLRTMRDPEGLDLLMHGVRRRNPDPVGLTPALAAISRDEGHSLRTRLDAAEAYRIIRRRARVDDEPEEMWAVFDALVLALAQADFKASFAYGEKIPSYLNPWAAGAIARLMLGEGVEINEMGNWFTDRPGVVALLGVWEPQIDDPVERFRLAMTAIAGEERSYSSKVARDLATQAVAIYFPEDSVNTSPPEPTEP